MIRVISRTKDHQGDAAAEMEAGSDVVGGEKCKSMSNLLQIGYMIYAHIDWK